MELLAGEWEMEPSYEALYRPDAIDPQPVDRRSVSAFFECSLGLSAWKSYRGARWALRCNPSSGNLHPTEGYLIIGPTKGIGRKAGVYHYAPGDHLLERRHTIDTAAWEDLSGRWSPAAFFVGISSIHWRESWKYGERAFRYCHHDVGHALACLRLAAASQGWRLRIDDRLGDARLARLFGLDRDGDFPAAEREDPDTLAVVLPAGASPRAEPDLDVSLVDRIVKGPWRGRANALSPRHAEWDIIEAVAGATRKPSSRADGTRQAGSFGAQCSSNADATGRATQPGGPSARCVMMQRRSGTAFDGRTSITRATFYGMMLRLMPGGGPPVPPWDAVSWPPMVHLCLFVHRVDGLTPGLYFLARDRSRTSALKSAMDPEFAWARPPGCPRNLPLHLLRDGDCRRAATRVSLDQDIAGSGAFSLGMIAEFEKPLREYGAWFYRRLFWEAGMVGQVLYMEAEAAGIRSGTPVRGTGIGAYYDDQVHGLLGLEDRLFQSLYHFTVGGAVEDKRLTRLPPYGRTILDRT